MNIKLQMLQCLLTATLSTLTILPSTTTAPIVINPEYLPITKYQESLSETISNYIRSILYKENQIELLNQSEPIAMIIEENFPELSREEALEEMKSITTKIFDMNDSDYLSTHLLAMKRLTQHLDQETDLKTIDAIHFLLENQHRSSLTDALIFWPPANKHHEFNKNIPVTQEVAKKDDYEKKSTLHKKMGLETKKRKDEAKKQEQEAKLKLKANL